MRRTLIVVAILLGIIVAYFLGANRRISLYLEEEGLLETNNLVRSDKELIKNGQKIDVDGYVIDGEEYYKMEDLESTLGFKTKTDKENKTIELILDEKVESSNFNPEDFREYSLEIDYKDNKVEIEYDRLADRVEAKYVNRKTGEKIRGEEAKNLIESKLLSIDYKAGEDEIVNTIIKNLGLDEDYRKFELDIDYADNNEFKIERIK